jgi:WD40 repeat protein
VLQPEDDSWAAVVYDSADDTAVRLGAAVVIDRSRLLTCLHVIDDHMDQRSVWVGFPKAIGFMHRDRLPAVVGATDPDLDVAVLRLPSGLPPGVTAAPLRSPPPHALRNKSWWAFGFPGSRRGNSSYGLVAESLGDGYIRLDADPAATYRLQGGFSGGGVWSPDFGAVIGVVVTADQHGNGEAVTLYQIDLCFPEEELCDLARWTASDAGETALAAWGWTLDRDPEGARHWRPKGRGVSTDSERGFRFRGRRAALTAITEWLGHEYSDRRALVVTGSPGVGKSAVLGRIVTTADKDAAAGLPISDQAVRAVLGSVACAVHAKGKTALEVATEITRAASAVLPDLLEDFAPALRASLTARGSSQFNVIIDALDEASSPEEARMIITKVILPLTETCADVGAQVIAGSRSSVGDINLLAAFGESMRVINLDDPEFFSDEDLEAYVLATLQLEGDERKGNPYADETAAQPIAARIAELSDRNFLVAGLTARAHGLHDHRAADPASVSFAASVDAAMRQYLQRLAPVADVPAEAALTALAFAEAPGIPLDLWQAALQALGAGHITTHQLSQFARSAAASFLVESNTNSDAAVFRLFHQALNDVLLHARAQIVMPAHDQSALVRTFTTVGRRRGWGQAPGYLLRSLPTHAAAAGMIDYLLSDDAYLLHADLRRLIPLVDHATSKIGRQRARLLWLTPRAITANPTTRIALFSVTEILEKLGSAFTISRAESPYRAKWSAVSPRIEHAVMEGHTRGITGICAFSMDGRVWLASGSGDTTVRIWDAATGAEDSVLLGHTDWVTSVCAFERDGRVWLASGSDDRTVRIWDAATGAEDSVLLGHTDWVTSVCAFERDGRAWLASGSDDRTVRIWDAATGAEHAVLRGHTREVRSICAFSMDGRVWLASGSGDTTVRIWDAATGAEHGVLRGHTREVRSICAFSMDGRVWLASGSGDTTVRIWDAATGAEHAVLRGHTKKVRSICAFSMDDRMWLASGSGSGDRTARIWDPVTATVMLVVPVYHSLFAITCVSDSLYVAVTAGLLAIQVGKINFPRP